MIGNLILIAILILSFKIVGLFLRILGKLLGIGCSILGYALVGWLAVKILCLGLIVLPIIAVVGVAAIIAAIL